MVYEMNDVFLDLSKLEAVSSLIGNGIGEYFFKIQINANIYISDVDSKKKIKKMKADLIEAWKEYKDQK